MQIIIAGNTLNFVYYFTEKLKLDISCELSIADHSHEISGLIFSEKLKYFRILASAVAVGSLTLKAPRKSASENVVCLCHLLHLLANFSNLHFAYRQTVWTQIRLLRKEQSDAVCNNDF